MGGEKRLAGSDAKLPPPRMWLQAPTRRWGPTSGSDYTKSTN
jgi:hypothetical protein